MNEKINGKRDQEIVKLYNAGASLQSLKEKYSVSHERIRQVLTNNGVDLRPRGRPKK